MNENDFKKRIFQLEYKVAILESKFAMITDALTMDTQNTVIECSRCGFYANPDSRCPESDDCPNGLKPYETTED